MTAPKTNQFNVLVILSSADITQMLGHAFSTVIFHHATNAGQAMQIIQDNQIDYMVVGNQIGEAPGTGCKIIQEIEKISSIPYCRLAAHDYEMSSDKKGEGIVNTAKPIFTELEKLNAKIFCFTTEAN